MEFGRFLPFVVAVIASVASDPVVAADSSVASALTITERRIEHASVPAGAIRVPVMSISFEASCFGDVVVSRIAVRRTGLGRNEDIAAVYAVENDVRISRASAIGDRRGTAQINLGNFVIESCGRRTVVIHADFSASASIAGIHRFSLSDTDPAQTSAESVRIDSKSSAVGGDITMTPEADADDRLEVTYPSPPSRISFGTGRTVGGIRLTAGGKKSFLIRAVTFKNLGTAKNRDIRNIRLTDRFGNQLSPLVDFLDGKRVRTVLDPPLVLSSGSTAHLQLKADVFARIGRTVRFAADEESDVEFTAVRKRR